uniref:Uncharacterized protein n=1 Tax=Lynx canadensis TaxID=61383 RepID=A0A667HTK5_LYNCA
MAPIQNDMILKHDFHKDRPGHLAMWFNQLAFTRRWHRPLGSVDPRRGTSPLNLCRPMCSS